MGHFSHSCKLTGLPITGGTPVALIVMKPNKNIYDNSEKHLNQFGSTYMCSNDGTRLKYTPIWFPIRGEYNDYGGIENIVKDDNTKVLEEYYGMTIGKLLAIITSGRKDDGYDDSLNIIKKPVERPKDQKKGEDYFVYYQRIMNKPMPCSYPDVSGSHKPEWQEEGYEGWTITRDGEKIKATKEEYDADFKLIHEHYAEYEAWKKVNPDVENDYGKPQYEERYKELLTYSGMWIHGEVYDKLTDIEVSDEYNKLDMGRPEVLKALGFVEGKKTKDKRYNRPFTHGKLTVLSDGNWIGGTYSQIYTVSDFKILAESEGETIDFSPIEKKGKIEQLYDIVIPTLKTIEPNQRAIEMLDDEVKLKVIYNDMYPNGEIEFNDFITKLFRLSIGGMPREEVELYYYFLNTGGYSTTKINNPLTKIYVEAAKKKKLKENLVRFWKFDSYMYACGRYYEIVGTAPQDGDHKAVQTVLGIAKDIIDNVIKEHEEYDDEDE